MEILFHPEAADEAAAARSWYSERSQRAADEFEAELAGSVDSLREYPLRWPPDTAGLRRLLMRRFPFAMVYILKLDEIQIIAVAHLHRRPHYWRERIGDSD